MRGDDVAEVRTVPFLRPQGRQQRQVWQPSGFRQEMPTLFYDNDMTGWGPELVKRRSEITMAMVEKFRTKMYRTNPDFVFTVTRDFVRTCQTPVLILPDDVPAHPYAVGMEPRCSRRRPK